MFNRELSVLSVAEPTSVKPQSTLSVGEPRAVATSRTAPGHLQEVLLAYLIIYFLFFSFLFFLKKTCL